MMNKMYILHLGDCLEVLPSVPSGSIDAIITDLPYGTTQCKWDSIIPFEPMWKEVKRVLKPSGTFITTASQPFASALVMSNPKWFKYEWVWNKSHSSGFQYAKYRPMQRHDNILVFGNGRINYYPQKTKGKKKASRSGKPETSRKADTVVGGGVKYNLSVVITDEYFPTTDLYFPCGARRGSIHPTQKPVALYEYLIRTYTREGETVLDIAAGSGTTIVAAENIGRNSIGIEKDEDIFKSAKNRIEGYRSQEIRATIKQDTNITIDGQINLFGHLSNNQ